MGKSYIIILGLYMLYYAGNIAYDLFLKKEKATETENSEQDFSLSDIAKQHGEDSISVGIDDVENIRIPKSFDNEESLFLSLNEEPQNLEDLKNKYEDENQLDEMEQNFSNLSQKQITEEKSIADRPIQSLNLQNIINDINTRVKMVSNYDGQKVYHIQ